MARAGAWDGSNIHEDHIDFLRKTRRLPSEDYVRPPPFLYHRLFRTVSSNWNRFLTDAPGAAAKTKGSAPPAATVSLSLPFLFAFAFDPVSRRLQCQALDPFSRRWLLLPPVPCGAAAGSFAVVGLPARGEIYVIGGVEEGGDKAVSSVAVYSAATNGWGQVAGMRTARGYMAAGEVGGRVVVASEDGEAEVFDPEAGRWSPAAPRGGAAVARYDAAAAGGKLYVTEGWAWPFERAPRGAVYDAAADAWSDMARGMREGWTGSCVVSGGRMYIVAEYGEWRLKRYDEPRDEWQMVAGGGVPQEVRRPHVVAGQLEEVGGGRRRIYVRLAHMPAHKKGREFDHAITSAVMPAHLPTYKKGCRSPPLEGATTLTSGKHSPEKREAC
ncbi:F-box protein AFR-like, partial [Triticum dicoccoides]|uniref:F-box protein AFR-like n=1 Tax=Triticum dicoccoides TaxID=85692 RepID=UPI00188F7F4B